MKSRYDYNPNVWRALQEQLGKSLLLAAVVVQSEMKKSLNTPYPPASKPGEFPHYRTGNLRESIVIDPKTPAECAAQGRVRIGYAKRAHYGAILEVMRHRLGLVATVTRLRTFLAKLFLKAKASQ